MKPIYLQRFAIVLAGFCFAVSAKAENGHDTNFDYSGYVELSTRWFLSPPSDEKQFSGGQVTMEAKPEFNWEFSDSTGSAQLVPVVRVDGRDTQRNKLDFSEAWLRKSFNNQTITVGMQQVFWGVTESRHLVNILNQVDTQVDVNEESFFGQFMVQSNWLMDDSELSIYLMTGFREREFSTSESRLNGGMEIVSGEFESGAKHWKPELALRYATVLEDVDLGISYFHGISREPTLKRQTGGVMALYENIDQLGVDIQYTGEEWLLKFEGIWRSGQGNDFGAFVSGFEYSFYQVMGSQSDVSLMMELLRDDRDDELNPVFNKDYFLGTRIALNNTLDTSGIIGFYIDHDLGASALRVEFETRLKANWKLNLDGQFFLEDDSRDVLSPFENDSYMNVRLTYHF